MYATRKRLNYKLMTTNVRSMSRFRYNGSILNVMRARSFRYKYKTTMSPKKIERIIISLYLS